MTLISSWREASLQKKLTLLMLFSILIPLLSLGIFSFLISSRITEEKRTMAGIDSLKQLNANLTFIIKDVENISLFLIGQRDVQQWLQESDEKKNTEASVVGMLTNLASSKEYIVDISLIPKSRIGAQGISSASIYASELPSHLELSKVVEKTWTDVYTIQDYSGQKNVITFARPLRSTHDYEALGWLTISIDEGQLSKYWANSGWGNDSLALTDERGIVLSAMDKSLLGTHFTGLYPGLTEGWNTALTGSVLHGQGTSKVSLLYVKQPQVNWMLTGAIPYEDYSAQNRYILLLTLAMIVLSLLISAALTTFVVHRVMNPLRVLTRLLSRIDPDRPLPRFLTESDDEIGRLGRSYNRLGHHITKLKEELVLQESRKKEADIRALQAQINPHFLYNTLSSIHWIALMKDEKSIADMVEALSDFLRFSLNKGLDYCPVHQELAHIRNYAQVQAIRFPDQFELDMMMDPHIADHDMLKLLLQPLVENALIHGIQKKDSSGTITVVAEGKGNRIHFVVHDDGIGMTGERLVQLKDQIFKGEHVSEAYAGYGLQNVQERLLLHYGKDSLLDIQSWEDRGTRISFSIPIVEVPHENHDR